MSSRERKKIMSQSFMATNKYVAKQLYDAITEPDLPHCVYGIDFDNVMKNMPQDQVMEIILTAVNNSSEFTISAGDDGKPVFAPESREMVDKIKGGLLSLANLRDYSIDASYTSHSEISWETLNKVDSPIVAEYYNVLEDLFAQQIEESITEVAIRFCIAQDKEEIFNHPQAEDKLIEKYGGKHSKGQCFDEVFVALGMGLANSDGVEGDLMGRDTAYVEAIKGLKSITIPSDREFDFLHSHRSPETSDSPLIPFVNLETGKEGFIVPLPAIDGQSRTAIIYPVFDEVGHAYEVNTKFVDVLLDMNDGGYYKLPEDTLKIAQNTNIMEFVMNESYKGLAYRYSEVENLDHEATDELAAFVGFKMRETLCDWIADKTSEKANAVGIGEKWGRYLKNEKDIQYIYEPDPEYIMDYEDRYYYEYPDVPEFVTEKLERGDQLFQAAVDSYLNKDFGGFTTPEEKKLAVKDMLETVGIEIGERLLEQLEREAQPTKERYGR